MSGIAMAAVLKHSRFYDRPEPFRILMAIAERADVNGVTGKAGDLKACPNRETIANDARVHKNTLANWLPLLAEAGELAYEVHGDGRGRHTVYRLLLPLDINTTYSDYATIDTSDQASVVSIGSHNDTYKLDLLTQQVALLTQQVALLTQGRGVIDTSDQREDVLDPLLDPILDPLDPGGNTRARARRPNHDYDTLLKDQPEAVRLYVALSGQWPGETNAGYIVERLGSQPDSVALERALRLWTASGYRSGNLPGLFDWYDELRRDPEWTPGSRFKPKAGTNGNGYHASRPTREIDRSLIVGGRQ
jgi:hypothetical protein